MFLIVQVLYDKSLHFEALVAATHYNIYDKTKSGMFQTTIGKISDIIHADHSKKIHMMAL